MPKLPLTAAAWTATVLLFTCLAVQAQARPEAAIQTFMDGFNSGDIAKASTMNSPSGTSIIDEFAPYTWTGPNAFEEWGAAFDTNAKALGITAPKVTLGAAIVRNVTGAQAYLIYPAVYTYKQKNVSMREPGRVAFALRKESDVWRIAAWTWAGTAPKAGK